ncbi:MAG: hypothetical protein KGD64_02305 [Candidatus Heimdallarchaeota archaeon]|nr:hypothetical protein [Candidatus Heimdallarchaeota archaeon]
MRNSRKMILLGVFFSLIIISSLNSNNIVRGQEYSYSLLLVPDVTYEWDVTTLTVVGAASTSFLDYGVETISQGDTLSAEILLDVNETAIGDPLQLLNISNVWVEFYLNSENVSTNIYDIGIFDLSWTGLGNYYFLEPTLYTNSTGAYDNFLIYHNSYSEVNYEERTEINEYAYYELEIENAVTSTKLSRDTWSINIDYSNVETIDNFRNPESWFKDHTTETLVAELRFNRETGLLTYLQYTFNWHRIHEIEGSLDDDVEGVDLLIESTLLPTSSSYDWSFAVAGLVVFSIVVVVRRKRK